jgi:hypothetical protein
MLHSGRKGRLASYMGHCVRRINEARGWLASGFDD